MSKNGALPFWSGLLVGAGLVLGISLLETVRRRFSQASAEPGHSITADGQTPGETSEASAEERANSQRHEAEAV